MILFYPETRHKHERALTGPACLSVHRRGWYNWVMTTLRAHFDGRFIVPDEPVDLPRDRTLEVQVREVEKQPQTQPARPEPPFPTFEVDAGDPVITSEDVRRGMDEI